LSHQLAVIIEYTCMLQCYEVIKCLNTPAVLLLKSRSIWTEVYNMWCW